MSCKIMTSQYDKIIRSERQYRGPFMSLSSMFSKRRAIKKNLERLKNIVTAIKNTLSNPDNADIMKLDEFKENLVAAQRDLTELREEYAPPVFEEILATAKRDLGCVSKFFFLFDESIKALKYDGHV